MFAHKINDLKVQDKILIGSVFTHKSQINQATYTYEITNITYGGKDINDSITLKLISCSEESSIDSFDIEPEWFNQRKINFHKATQTA